MTRNLRLSELIGALSSALDLTEGQPEGHCVRCCWVGMHLAGALGLSDEERWDLYYTLLLKDLGCSSNAARVCELYLTDDRAFKRAVKTVDDTHFPEAFRFVLRHTGLHASVADRFKAIWRAATRGEDDALGLIQTRCDRGASIAARLRFSPAVQAGIRGLDEHWDGGGKPLGLAGDEIPLASRIALLAQIVDVFHTEGGRAAAVREVRGRAGQWLDPSLVEVFETVAADDSLWAGLVDPQLRSRIIDLAPASHDCCPDDDHLDDIAAAFGEVIDSKSPYTSGHSHRVARFTDHIAAELGLSVADRRWLRRGALLHDLGKLGVSNLILDKPGRLTEDEWGQVQRHALYTEQILGQIGVFERLAKVAGAHHERLDGTGYPHGLAGDEITLETRILTVADIFDALTAERPYRGAMPLDRAFGILDDSVGTAVDGAVVAALHRVMDRMSLRDALAA